MKYHALFVIFEKAAKFENCRLLQIIGGALRVKYPADSGVPNDKTRQIISLVGKDINSSYTF